MTLADLIKDLIDTSKERLKTPISGAFLWSFLIYNWRPIVFLCFSEASIEDKIVIVNNIYCGFGALLMPFIIALVYTVGVPMFMLKIDKFLEGTKKARIEKIYTHKGYVMDGRIKLGRKEFQLKNIESGNKEIDDFLNQIKTLEESKTQIIEANKNTVEQLNQKLEDANKLNQLLFNSPEYGRSTAIDDIKKKKDSFYYEDLNRIANSLLTPTETKEISSLKINDEGYLVLKTSNISQSMLSNLVEIRVLTIENNRYKVTDYGNLYIDSVKKLKK